MSSRVVALAFLCSQLLVRAHPPTNSAAAPLPPAVVAHAPAISATNTFKKSAGYPFRGKLAGIDLAHSTIHLGKSTYWITPQTKITKMGAAARLSDGVVGEEAVGYARKAADGRAVAASLRFGPKVELTPSPAAPVSRKK